MCSAENLRASVDNCQKVLGPIKKIDLYQPARIDPKVPFETIMSNLIALRDEGKFGHIGLSECKGSTLRKAYAASRGYSRISLQSLLTATRLCIASSWFRGCR